MSVVLSRRGALMVPVLVVAGGAAACSKDPKPDGSGSGAAPSGSASAGASLSVVLETSVDAVPTRVEVGPLVRVGKRSVLRLHLTTEGESINVAASLEGWKREAYTMQGILVMSLTEPEARVWGETDMSNIIANPWTKEEGIMLMPTFGEIPAGLESVTVLLPSLGVVSGVPVVDEAQAGFDAAGAIAEAKIDDSIAGPFVLSTFTAAADGSSETSVGADSVTEIGRAHV